MKPQDGPLINKQYYCLQYGNETAIRFSSTALPNHKKLFSSNPIKKKGSGSKIGHDIKSILSNFSQIYNSAENSFPLV